MLRKKTVNLASNSKQPSKSRLGPIAKRVFRRSAKALKAGEFGAKWTTTFAVSLFLTLFAVSVLAVIWLHSETTPHPMRIASGQRLAASSETQRLHELFRLRFAEALQSAFNEKGSAMPRDFEVAELINAVFGGAEIESEVNFVQIGACDGDWAATNDPIQRMILSRADWHGVMLEPVPFLFAALTQSIAATVVLNEHRILPINAAVAVAVAESNAQKPFFVVSKGFAEEAPQSTHALKRQIGSFSKEHIAKHLRKIKEPKLKFGVEHYIEAISVATMNPKTVLKAFRDSGKAVRDGTIDVLIIDAEGFDLMVLEGFLALEGVKPLLVIYETLHLQNEAKKTAHALLTRNGYLHFRSGWNDFAVKVANLS